MIRLYGWGIGAQVVTRSKQKVGKGKRSLMAGV